MNSLKPVFGGHQDDFDDYEWEAPLSEVRDFTCDYFVSAFSAESKKLNESGDMKGERVFRFLATLFSFSDRYDDRITPYHAMWISPNGTRSIIPEDLSDSDLEIIDSLIEKANDPAMKGRLADILWIRRKEHQAAKIAAESFVASAQRLMSLDEWVLALNLFQRALQLGVILGRKSSTYIAAEAATMDVIRQEKGSDTSLMTCQFIEMVLTEEAGDSAEMAQIAKDCALTALANDDQRVAESYWEVAASAYHRTKNPEKAKIAMKRAADAIYLQGKQRSSGPNPSHMAASSFFARAVETLRRNGGEPEQVKEWKEALYESQKKSISEMQSFTTEIDIKKGVRSAELFVQSENLQDALVRLAFGVEITNLEALREDVKEAITESPLYHLLSASHVDKNGRVLHQTPGITARSGEEAEAAFEAQMFRHASNYHWSLRAQAFIDPARRKVWRDHQPALHELTYLIRNNPFVPPGHEGIFLRGIHAGLAGDFLIASHLLTPQIENSLRYVLESHGIDVTNLKNDMSQPVKLLGPLLGMQETKDIFGESLVFELRGLLIEKSAYGFRDRLAHGLIMDHECYGLDALQLWWLVLRFCLIPSAKNLSHP